MSIAEIIRIDFQLRWRHPVFIIDLDGHRRRIDGPDDALDALMRQWPRQRGAGYSSAKVRCIDALRKRGSVELAMRSFVDAAMAAGIYS